MTHKRLSNVFSLMSIALLIALSHSEARAGSVACDSDPEFCPGDYSSLFAMAHAYGPAADNLLYRITIPAWQPSDFVTDAGWTGDLNGFFYQVITRQSGSAVDTQYFAPFNGIHIDTDRLPKLPAFHMYPSIADVGIDTTIEVRACSSNYLGSIGAPACTQEYWSDEYETPSQPAVTPSPPINSFVTAYTMTMTTYDVADNGLYAASGKLTVDPDLTDDELQWIFDHTAFFAEDGAAYSNDIHRQGVGILEFDEAVYLDIKDGNHHLRYGDGSPVTEPSPPDRQLFFYATNLISTTKIKIAMIYDQSETCTGNILGNGSNNTSCSSRHTGTVAGVVDLTLNAKSWRPTSNSGFDVQAGTQGTRTISLNLNTSSTDIDGLCGDILNPLAVYPQDDTNPAFRPPNYVVSNADWSNPFPIGLYYVIDGGFGNCVPDSGSSTAPFCQQTPSYIGYVPHYRDLQESFGELNGGSTGQTMIGGFKVFDKYALGNINGQNANTLIFFDSCGYGHTYQENNQGLRSTLPSAPSGWTTRTFTIENNYQTIPVVYGKECCASWYQLNDNVTPNINEPPHQLDNSYGMFIPSGQSPAYETLFSREANVVYDAVSGDPLFKLFVDDVDDAVVYACSDFTAAVGIAGDISSRAITLGSTGTDALGCSPVGTCPFGMSATQSGSEITCEATDSTFIVGLQDWAGEQATEGVQLGVWGGKGTGDTGTNGGGLGGFAYSVIRPADTPEALYVYVGKRKEHRGDGGSATVLTSSPLSLTGSDAAETTTIPSEIGGLLISGGGGGTDLDSTSVGGGGIAIANSISLSGVPESVAGETGGGGGSNAGQGGNQDGIGSGGGKSSTSGVGGTGGGGVDWNTNGALIPPTTSPLSWGAGHGSNGNLTGGGGGFGGGAHPGNTDHGAGGGGSWAMANTVYEPLAPTSRPDSPAGTEGALQLSYVLPPCVAVETRAGSAVRCTYNATVRPLDVSNLVRSLFGSNVSGDLPVVVEAWGGRGGNGTHYVSAQPFIGGGGRSGYARTVLSLSELEAMSASELYLYPGERGTPGNALQTGNSTSPLGGDGGASSIVSAVPLGDLGSTNTITDPSDQSVVLIAGGGAGGGSLLNGFGGEGGHGAVSIATTTEHRSCGGFPGDPASSAADPFPTDGVEGLGGNGGLGLCSTDRTGMAGGGGNNGGGNGNDAVGGFGGRKVQLGSEPPKWSGSVISDWTAGNGGGSSTTGGGGGAGFGGGGSGGKATSGIFRDGGGGGGGGSWARQASFDDLEAPAQGRRNQPTSNGAGSITLTFDICGVDASSSYCETTTPMPRITPRMSLVAEPSARQSRLRIHGSETFDVEELDLERFGFGFASVSPTSTAPPEDLDGDGYDDIDLVFDDFLALSYGVHCFHSAFEDGSPVYGCAREQTAPTTPVPTATSVPRVEYDDSCRITAPGASRSAWWLLLPLLGLLWRRRQ